MHAHKSLLHACTHAHMHICTCMHTCMHANITYMHACKHIIHREIPHTDYLRHTHAIFAIRYMHTCTRAHVHI